MSQKDFKLKKSLRLKLKNKIVQLVTNMKSRQNYYSNK